jgi:hypothetical protein
MGKVIMNVVHFSITPLAGSPFRLVKELNKIHEMNVRLVDLKRNHLYEGDLYWNENKDEIIELVKNADLIHVHNYFDLNSKWFDPIDFLKIRRKGQLIRQFHSHPRIVSRHMNISEDEILNSDIPSIVVAQFQERYYPSARVVRNIIPDYSKNYHSSDEGYVFFAPTNMKSSIDDRWNTKGAIEVLNILKKMRKSGIPYKLIHNVNFKSMMDIKSRARLVIDDPVTGSYHLSSLEGLSLSKPTLCRLDARCEYVMRTICGAPDLPIININLINLPLFVHKLGLNKELCKEIGEYSGNWFSKYWNPSDVVNDYIKSYKFLLNGTFRNWRQSEFNLTNTPLFYIFDIADLSWKGNANFFKIKRLKLFVKRIKRKLCSFKIFR